MPLSPKEADTRALQLVSRLISKITKDNHRWTQGWKRTILLDVGYSPWVVRKAEEYDCRGSNFARITTIFSSLLLALVYWGLGSTVVLWAVILISGFQFALDEYHSRRVRISYADNLRVIDEIEARLGKDFLDEIPEEHPLLEKWNRRLEKKALLWRLDAFLSRKSPRK